MVDRIGGLGVEIGGFEPPTSCMRSKRSSQLSYTPVSTPKRTDKGTITFWQWAHALYISCA